MIPETGSTLGAYRLVRELGAGGMGAVWLAEHAMLGRRAAIKLLHPSFAARPEIVARFFNEARAATAIADPGIVQIFDFGHHGSTAYIVMELLEGESLEQRLRREQVLRVDQAVRLARQVASSLGAAHARGIVHRDLKPDNIFLVPDPEVAGGERAKILDFGIAKLANDNAGVQTQTSALMGTPLYMSPEQCRGAGGVDQRSDVYSLGCILFQLITGRTVFQAEGAGELLIAHVMAEAPRVSSLRSVAPELDELIARCLTKDPAQRPTSGRELATLLATVVPGSSPDLQMSAAALPAVAKTTLSSAAAVIAEPPRRNRAIFPLALLALFAIAVVATVVATRSSSSVVPSAPPPPIVVDASVVTVVDAAVPDMAVPDAAVVDAAPDAPVVVAKPVKPHKPVAQPAPPPPPSPAPLPTPPPPVPEPKTPVGDGTANPFQGTRP